MFSKNELRMFAYQNICKHFLFTIKSHHTVSRFIISAEKRATVFACLSVCQLPDMWDDGSDCEADGLWWGWLDQVERYQTTHSGWHKLWGLSVLGGRGSTGTTEPLQSNILIRRETDTPVHHRVMEREVTEEEKGGGSGTADRQNRGVGCRKQGTEI